MRIAESKASDDEVESYKQFMVTAAAAVANANREGDFIGIGGKPVSAREQAALDEIRSTLWTTS